MRTVSEVVHSAETEEIVRARRAVMRTARRGKGSKVKGGGRIRYDEYSNIQLRIRINLSLRVVGH